MRSRCLLHRLLVHEAEPAGDLAAEEEIGDGVEILRQREVLVDRLDAERFGVARSSGSTTGLPANADLAAVGGEDAGEDLDQRRLAGAVVAEQAEHLARAQIEAHVLDRMDAAEGLDDVAQLDERRVMSSALRR